MKMIALIVPLAISASAFAATADQPGDQADLPGPLPVAEAEKVAGLHRLSKRHTPEEGPETASGPVADPTAGARATFSGRGLSMQQKRIFVISLEARGKK